MDWLIVLERLAMGVCAVSLLWFSLLLAIVGNRRLVVTKALFVSFMSLALNAYMALAILSFGASTLYAAACLGLQAIAAVSWYWAIFEQAKRAFSPSRHRIYWRLMVVFAAVAGASALVGTTFAGYLATSPVTILALSVVMLTALPVVGSAVILLLARRRYLSTKLDLHRQQGLRSLAGFFYAPYVLFFGMLFTGMVVLLAPTMPASHADHLTIAIADPIIGSLLLLTFGACGLRIIHSNPELLGRRVPMSHLIGRWTLLAALLTLLVVLSWPPESGKDVNLLVSLFFAPFLVAGIEWMLYSVYTRSIEQSRRVLIHEDEAVLHWDAEALLTQANRMFQKLVEELRPDACYLQLQVDFQSEPFVLNHHWGPPYIVDADYFPPNPRDNSRYDHCHIDVLDRHIGFVTLLGPGGSHYSSAELELAQAAARRIAKVYLEAKRAQDLEVVLGRKNQEIHERSSYLQRVLHDEVGGRLTSIQFACDALKSHRGNPEIKLRRISKAAEEAMNLVRTVLRAELAELYPTTLREDGLIAALRSELLPRYRHQRYGNMQITLESENTDDASLNIWLSEELKRILYDAIEEALRNTASHAGSDGSKLHAHVRITRDDIGLHVEISDDGVGFAVAEADARNRGLGLKYRSEAIRLAGGVMDITSNPGAGTKVHILLPAGLLHPPQVAHSNKEWEELILLAERQLGGRLMVNDDLSDMTRPSSVAEQYFQRRGMHPELARRRIEIENHRRRLFDQYVQHFAYRDIVDQVRLQRYIKTGTTDDGWTGVDVTLARQHVQNVINMLRQHANYSLGLTDTSLDSNYLVKPGHAVLWEKRASSGEGRVGDFFEGIYDMDPHVVADFSGRFESLWKGIPKEFRDKEAVINWLERQLEEARSAPDLALGTKNAEVI